MQNKIPSIPNQSLHIPHNNKYLKNNDFNKELMSATEKDEKNDNGTKFAYQKKLRELEIEVANQLWQQVFSTVKVSGGYGVEMFFTELVRENVTKAYQDQALFNLNTQVLD